MKPIYLQMVAVEIHSLLYLFFWGQNTFLTVLTNIMYSFNRRHCFFCLMSVHQCTLFCQRLKSSAPCYYRRRHVFQFLITLVIYFFVSLGGVSCFSFRGRGFVQGEECHLEIELCICKFILGGGWVQSSFSTLCLTIADFQLLSLRSNMGTCVGFCLWNERVKERTPSVIYGVLPFVEIILIFSL